MALLLSLPARAPTAVRTAPVPTGTADIIILPCIRHERIELGQKDFPLRTGDLPTQRQA